MTALTSLNLFDSNQFFCLFSCSPFFNMTLTEVVNCLDLQYTTKILHYINVNKHVYN